MHCEQIGMLFVHRLQPQRPIKREFDSVAVIPGALNLVERAGE